MDIRNFFKPAAAAAGVSTPAAPAAKKADQEDAKRKRTPRAIEDDSDDQDFQTPPSKSKAKPKDDSRSTKKTKVAADVKPAPELTEFFGGGGVKRSTKTTAPAPTRPLKATAEKSKFFKEDAKVDMDVETTAVSAKDASDNVIALDERIDKTTSAPPTKNDVKSSPDTKKRKDPPSEDKPKPRILPWSDSSTTKSPKKASTKKVSKDDDDEFLDEDDDDVPIKPAKKPKVDEDSKKKSPAAASKKAPAAEADDEEKKAKKSAFFARQAAGTIGVAAKPGSKDIPQGDKTCLSGLTFVFSGDGEALSRDEADAFVKRHGGRTTGAVSGKTSYLVVGENAGESKTKKAKEKGVKVINEDELLDLVRNAAPSSTSAAPVASKSEPAKKKCATPKTKNVDVASVVKHANSSQSRDTSAADSARAAGNIDMWTIKYKPTTYDEVLGNKANVKRLGTWLKNWNAGNRDDKPPASRGFGSTKEEPGNARAILISGPPGIGKTTAAHLAARMEGLEPIEFNASDARSRKTVKELVGQLVGNHAISEFFASTETQDSKVSGIDGPATKPVVLIMDEVDGMSSGDRGGTAELILLIKKTKVPIICICNDRQSPKVKSLANYCYDMRFQKPKATEIEKTIRSIALNEGLSIDDNVIGQLCTATQGDIRQILNMLQSYGISNANLGYDQSRKLTKDSEKNMSKSIFELMPKLLNRQTFREMSFAQKIEIYFNDYSIIPLMVQENYIKMDSALAKESGGDPNLNQLFALASAADSIMEADMMDKKMRGGGNWGMMPLHGVMSTVRPAFFVHGSLQPSANSFYGGGYSFPSWLGKNSTQSKNWRLLADVHQTMRIRISGDRNEVRLHYMPLLAKQLTAPLSAQGQDGIANVIDLMDYYYLNRENWDTILELCLPPLTAKELLADVPTAVKSAFTRTYNKTSHPVSLMHLMPGADKVKKSRGGGGGEVPDDENAVLEDDAVESDEDEGEDGENDSIPQPKEKVTKGKGPAKGKAASSSAGGAAKKETGKGKGAGSKKK